MAIRYLRNKVDGFIYEYDEILAKNAKCEEVSEQEAYPERFVAAVMENRPPAQVVLGVVVTEDITRQAAAEEYKPGAPSDDDIGRQLTKRFG